MTQEYWSDSPLMVMSPMDCPLETVSDSISASFTSNRSCWRAFVSRKASTITTLNTRRIRARIPTYPRVSRRRIRSNIRPPSLA